MSIPPSSLQGLLWFEHYFSAPVRLLIVLRQSITLVSYLILFLVPIILSLHISVGSCFEPVDLKVPARLNLSHFMVFQSMHFYSTTSTTDILCLGISTKSCYRPVHSQVCQSLRHSNHRYFIDPRLISNIIHLWITFDCDWLLSNKQLRLLSADFTVLYTH